MFWSTECITNLIIMSVLGVKWRCRYHFIYVFPSTTNDKPFGTSFNNQYCVCPTYCIYCTYVCLYLRSSSF